MCCTIRTSLNCICEYWLRQRIESQANSPSKASLPRSFDPLGKDASVLNTLLNKGLRSQTERLLPFCHGIGRSKAWLCNRSPPPAGEPDLAVDKWPEGALIYVWNPSWTVRGAVLPNDFA